MCIEDSLGGETTSVSLLFSMKKQENRIGDTISSVVLLGSTAEPAGGPSHPGIHPTSRWASGTAWEKALELRAPCFLLQETAIIVFI